MIRRTGLALLLAAFSNASGTPALAQAQKAPATYEPTSGQEGKDVVWVPTPQVVVDKMLDMAKVKPSDFVMDLGSGDGRTVITAAKRGARALGVEASPWTTGKRTKPPPYRRMPAAPPPTAPPFS